MNTRIELKKRMGDIEIFSQAFSDFLDDYSEDNEIDPIDILCLCMELCCTCMHTLEFKEDEINSILVAMKKETVALGKD